MNTSNKILILNMDQMTLLDYSQVSFTKMNCGINELRPQKSCRKSVIINNKRFLR